MNVTKMMSDAYRLRKSIEAETIEVEENGIRITIGGDLKIKEIVIRDSEDPSLRDAVNNAIRKVQEMQVEKMKEFNDLKNEP